ncbi:MerR family transcriptional regulator [Anaerovorax odorimutans]|nr:MerR family transcriptional regulator [Anaerovorax odorimutans]
MKIGEFAKKYNVPISTIRYYIEEGLITPKKHGAQYNFNEFNESEMQLLIDLRDSSFSLEEMRQFVNISRIFDEKDPLRCKELGALFMSKKKLLAEQIQSTKAAIETINLKLRELAFRETVLTASAKTPLLSDKKTGLPLKSLSFIVCPDCESVLDMDNVKLSAGSVISGSMRCSCGYEGYIQDGIICVDKNIDLDQDPSFCDDYFIDPTTSEHESLFYEGFLSAPQRYLSINYEARTWLNEIIINRIPHPDTVLFPDIASVFPYLYSNAEYLKNATIIIMGLSRETIAAVRKHIDSLQTDLNIIYIVTASNKLPLKKKSINLLIDYLGSYNYAFFFNKPLYEYLDPYFSDSASIAGCLCYYKTGAKSPLNISREYGRAMNPFITLSSYMDTLLLHGYTVIEDKKIGYNTVFSEYFHYHENGEKQYLHTLLAVRPAAPK